jgi:hypothetical protein
MVVKKYAELFGKTKSSKLVNKKSVQTKLMKPMYEFYRYCLYFHGFYVISDKI